MDLKQVVFSVLMMVVLGLVDARWPGVWNVQSTAEEFSVKSEKQFPVVPSRNVIVICNETAVYVEVNKNLFGNGRLLDTSALTLGGCAAKREDGASQVLIYESELNDCNSNLMVTEDELVYIFTLGIASGPLSGAPVSIECHYPRFPYVPQSTLIPNWVPHDPLMPNWIPHDFTQAAEEPFVLSLRLMMGDWVSGRPSNQYFLGELINIEASVVQFNHVPLRVLVDYCVATNVPDMNAIPRYSFIVNYGCLIDSKVANTRSRFLPQMQATKLGFQIEAFRFQQRNSSLGYITCSLKVTLASNPPDAVHKACSFSSNGWAAAYGDDQLCNCCNSHCSLRKERELGKGNHLVSAVTLGPITFEESTTRK